MISRKLGNVIRGKATPFQLVAASVLASMIAFVPGWEQAPGLLLALIALLVIINANLFFAGLVGAGAKLVALLLTPASFAIGRFLLEGPTRGLFGSLVNAPLLAWFGFEYYTVTGGMVLGAIIGLVVGLFTARGLLATWRQLAALEKDSARYQKLSASRWVKGGAFIFVGGLKGKKSYEELLNRKIGNPVRPIGIVAVVLLGVLLFVGVQFFNSSIVTAMVRSGLEDANGATVDLERASVDLAGGEAVFAGLAMADPDNLAVNVFSATGINAKISTGDLLRKRYVVDSVVVVGGRQGDRRATPGSLVGPRLKPADDGASKFPDMKSLEDVLENPELWQERLETVQRWLEKFSAPGPSGDEGNAGPSYEDVLRERIRLLGYNNVRDESLIAKSPTLLIRRLEADEVTAAALPDESLKIRALNISTQPNLVPEPPTFTISSASDRLRAEISLPVGAGDTGARLEFALKGLAVDEAVGQLKTSGTPVAQGGTMDLAASGRLGAFDTDLPLSVTLRDTRISVAGSTPTAISEITIPVEVRGALTRPSVRVDAKALQDALVASGKKELSRRLEGEAARLLGGSGNDEGSTGNGSLEDTAKGMLGGFLKQKPSDETEKKATQPEPSR